MRCCATVIIVIVIFGSLIPNIRYPRFHNWDLTLKYMDGIDGCNKIVSDLPFCFFPRTDPPFA